MTAVPETPQKSRAQRWARLLLEWSRAQFILGAKRGRAAWEAFRSRSIYFQLKALVVVGYAAIVFATIAWAPPASLARNTIGARILVLDGDVVVGRYFVIYNDSRQHWQNVRFEIDGGYVVERDLVRAGEKVTLYVKDFKRVEVRKRRGREIEKRVAAPIAVDLSALTVRTDEGMAVQPIAVGRPDGALP